MSEGEKHTCKFVGWPADISPEGMSIHIPMGDQLSEALESVQLPDAVRNEEGSILSDIFYAGIGQSVTGDRIPVDVQVTIRWPKEVVEAVERAKEAIIANAKEMHSNIDEEEDPDGEEDAFQEWCKRYDDREGEIVEAMRKEIEGILGMPL